jgi:predicted SnoaL-like aldol condensation-catalyzing enzyme
MEPSALSPKEVVEAASRLLEARRGLEAVEKYFAPNYIEHNPSVAGGDLAGFLKMLRDERFTEDSPPDGRDLRFHADHIICEGEFVVVHQHVTEPGKPTLVFMDIYRVRNGRIMEHWDVIQTAPDNPVNRRVPMW